MREVPISSRFLAFSPVAATLSRFCIPSDILVLFVNGSDTFLVTRRDKDATWRSLAAHCRERGWSKQRAVYELQNGLRFRTVPTGHEHEVDWHAFETQHNLNLETGELSLVGLDFLTVAIELTDDEPPADEVPADEAPTDSAGWAIVTTRRLRAEGETEGIKTKAALARLLEDESEKAVKAGQIRRALKASYLEDQLKLWGIWPLDAFE
jgi:hypothetical protein